MVRAIAIGVVMMSVASTPSSGHAWNFAYAKAGKALAEVKKELKRAALDLVGKVFGERGREIAEKLTKMKGRLRDIATKATKSVALAVEQLRNEAVGKAKELGLKLGDQLTDGLASRLNALKDASEKEVRQWIDGVQKLRSDALGTLERAVKGAIDPGSNKDNTVLEKLLSKALLKAFGPLARRVMAALEKLTADVRETASKWVNKAAATLQKIGEKAVGAVVGFAEKAAQKLREGVLDKLVELQRDGAAGLAGFIERVGRLRGDAMESLSRATDTNKK